MRGDSGSGAALGVIVGAILVVLVAVFFFGGFDFVTDGPDRDVNVTIDTPVTPPTPTPPAPG